MGVHIYNFNERFADAILSGAKRMTIRAPRKDGRLPIAGEALHLYTGLRTKKSRLLAKCVATQPHHIVIFVDKARIFYAGALLRANELRHFARDDGFDDESGFFDFFRNNYCMPVFSGFCIEWDPHSLVSFGVM